jgi:hypothetical protein
MKNLQQASMATKLLISVENLVKEFRVARREEGLKGAMKYLFSREFEFFHQI